MGEIVKLYKSDYATYYQYRKAIKRYRQSGYIVRNVCCGVWCFASQSDYDMWLRQK